MFLGRVVGTVWSSVKWKELGGLKLLIVRPLSAKDLGMVDVVATAPDDEGVVCADVLDAGVGDEVVVAYGHAARVAIADAESMTRGERPGIPIDAAVVAVVDRYDSSSGNDG